MFDQLYESETATPVGAVTLSTPAAPAAVVTSIKAAVLAQFKATEPVLKALVTRYENVAIDCSTPKGLAAAKEARHDLRENGRFVVQRARDAIKGEINALKPLLESEAERLIAIVQPVEDLYDVPIKAREVQLAAEKAERERKEAERVAGHRANIAKLASYIGAAQGKTSVQILTVINGVSGIEIIPEQWEEFAASAETQKTDTLEALQALFDRTKTAEDEAAAREAQRVENARVAAELADAQRVMAAKQAELDAKLAAIAAAEKAEADRIAAAAKAQEDAARAISEAAARQVAEDEANAKAQEAAAQALQAAVDATPAEVIADAYTPSTPAAADMAEVAAQAWALPTSPITFAEPPAPAADEPATLNLTAINDRFGGALSVTAAGLAILGIQPAAQVKAARLYRESQFIELCDALVDHIGNACTAAA
jgi:hypothetical protein